MRAWNTESRDHGGVKKMPKAQTGMAVGKYHPNTYDVNLVKCHDDNSAINRSPVISATRYSPLNASDRKKKNINYPYYYPTEYDYSHYKLGPTSDRTNDCPDTDYPQNAL